MALGVSLYYPTPCTSILSRVRSWSSRSAMVDLSIQSKRAARFSPGGACVKVKEVAKLGRNGQAGQVASQPPRKTNDAARSKSVRYRPSLAKLTLKHTEKLETPSHLQLDVHTKNELR
ncbi:hypothetical protein M3J09_001588 [Ascochyta lentis]